MEATNVYWEALAQFLYDQEHTVSVVNPARIKGCAQRQLVRNKTDKQDSATMLPSAPRPTRALDTADGSAAEVARAGAPS